MIDKETLQIDLGKQCVACKHLCRAYVAPAQTEHSLGRSSAHSCCCNSGKAGQRAKRQGREGANGAEASESDDDFAAAQVRRALGAAASSHARRLEAAAVLNASGGNSVGLGSSSAGASGVAVGGAARGAQALGAIETLVDSLRQQKAQEERMLHKVQGQLTAAIGAVGDLDRRLTEAGARYSFLQEVRAYLRDLCACLEHKAADVEALEEARLEAMREHCKGSHAERDEVCLSWQDHCARASIYGGAEWFT
jgi:hypothetical protein